MKTSYLLAAALALASVPGIAAASPADAPRVVQNDSDQYQGGASGDASVGGQLGTDESVGGSGSVGSDSSQCPCPEPGVGGTGQEQGQIGGTGTYGESEQQQQGTYGQEQQPQGGTGAYGQGEVEAPSQNVVIIEDKGAKREAANKGVSIKGDGGAAGYTGDLAPNVDPGGTWGVMLTAQPTSIVGLELGYEGAVNNISDPRAPDGRITRNGGSADLKFSLAPTKVEPYVFGGVGFARANVTNAPAASGYVDDTFGTIPVGGGIDFHIAQNVTAGLRGTYQLLFSRDFSPNNETGVGFTGEQPNIWNGVAQLGAKF